MVDVALMVRWFEEKDTSRPPTWQNLFPVTHPYCRDGLGLAFLLHGLRGFPVVVDVVIR
jgi:hypothetical protein